jgi:hypothetical protein
MKKIALMAAAFALPLVTFAQPRVANVQDLGGFIVGLINNVAVPVVFALAFIVFIWGVFRYFIGGKDDAARKEGKNLMLYGLLGFFIMISVWGLVNILVGSVGLDSNAPSRLPTTPQSGNL